MARLILRPEERIGGLGVLAEEGAVIDDVKDVKVDERVDAKEIGKITGAEESDGEEVVQGRVE